MSRASTWARRGVALDDSDYVITDDFQNTNVAGVHAIGDVTGPRRADAGGDRRRPALERSAVRRQARAGIWTTA